MVIVSEPAVKSGYKLSQQLMFDNAIAVFGLVPIFALAVMYHEQGDTASVEYLKRSMMRFRDYTKEAVKFRERVESNMATLNGDKPRGFDLKTIDMALTDLGYYETYNSDKLDSEIKQLVNFLNIGV